MWRKKASHLDQDSGLTHKVINSYKVNSGFIGVHPFSSAVNSRL